MANTRLKEVTAAELNQLVNRGKPVLADFSATWCGPCKAMLPIVERLATRFAGQAEVVKVDVDRAGELAIAHGVRSVPTFLLFADGEVTERIVGLTSEDALASLIESQISPATKVTAPQATA